MPKISAPLVRAVAIGLAAVVLVVLLMVSTGGQLDVVQAPADTTTATAAAPAGGSGPPAGLNENEMGALAPVAVFTGLIILAAFVVGGVLALLLSLRKIVGGRRRIAPIHDEGQEDQLLAAVAEDSSEHLSALRGGAPRDAIIACWTSLESTMRRAGLEPDAAETSTELVQRTLSAYPIEPGPIERLAALYREARFSSHEIPETSRALAVDAIERLHAELSGVRRDTTHASAPGRGR